MGGRGTTPAMVGTDGSSIIYFIESLLWMTGGMGCGRVSVQGCPDDDMIPARRVLDITQNLLGGLLRHG